MKFASKLTALFISISAIFAAFMFTIAYFQVAKILEGEIRARMENRVFFIMDTMDRFLYEKLSDISVISHDPVISSGNATAEQLTERLIFFRNAYKCYVSLSFFNLERIRIADTAGLNISEQNRMTRYWEDILSGKVSAASDVHIAENLQVPIVYFASVVNNKEGRAIGVVVARIPTSRLFEMVKVSAGIQEEEEEEEEEDIDLVNKDGLLIYSNHNREGILKENLLEWELIKIAQREKIFGSAKYRNPDEKEAEIHAFCREQGYLDFKGNGWTIISNIPTRVIFDPVNKLLKILIMMFLVTLPELALISYLFSKTVTRPLTRLSAAAEEIGKGKIDTVIEVKSKDEFGSLANIFNQMAADLKKTTTSIDNLNKEVTERKKIEEKHEVLVKDLKEGQELLKRQKQGMDDSRRAIKNVAEDLARSKQALEEQKGSVEKINKELDDFTYIVSHDLKEPLRSIDAFSKFLEDDYKDKIDNEGRDYIKRIRANATRMQDLIEDLLELSRIERKQSPFDEMEAEELINEAKLRLEYRIKEKNAEIVVPVKLPRLTCDRVRLTEVFVNLIANAIKFNDKSNPRIEIGYSQKGAFYEFYVKDNGPGIEQQYFNKIFEIFQRLGKREEHEGTGAGLTIAKKIVEMHKGKIWVESKVGKGTTFYFTIPKEKEFILGKRKLGEILIEKKVVTEEEIKKALEEQERMS